MNQANYKLYRLTAQPLPQHMINQIIDRYRGLLDVANIKGYAD